MHVYTIRKSDLYKSGIEPTYRLLNDSEENKPTEFYHVLAKILMELGGKERNRT